VNNSLEHQVLRIKPKASKMFIPTLILGVVSFALAFVVDQFSPNDYNIALIVAAAVLTLFWFFPLLGYLTSSLKLTNQRLIHRFGFLGLRKRKLALSELSSIEIQTEGRLGRKIISILSVDGSEIRIGGYARTKLLAAEIEALAKATI
jgi:MFS family permease